MSMQRFLQYLLFLAYCFNTSADHRCSNDEDLRYHQCQCNEIDRSIRCLSLPHRCRTCTLYQTIYFDQSIEILPEEIFAEYQLSNFFRIHFIEVKNISLRAFSKIHLQPNQILNIEIIKYSSSYFPTHAFEQLILSSNSKFHLEIHQITNAMFSIEKHAFVGIEFHHRSYFQFFIRHAIDTIAFQTHSGSMVLSSNARMELNFSNFSQLIGFERAFDGIKQEESSELRIVFNQFSSASFSHRIFSNIHQLARSSFHLSFSNFDSLIFERTFLEHVIQLNSSLMISIINQTNNLCLNNETLTNITQENYSIFRLKIHSGQNLLFSSEAIHSLTLKSRSKFIIDIIHCYDTYFSRNSLVNFSLIDQSMMDIGIQSGQNLIFETNAIEQIDLFTSSRLKIAFQYSHGTFQMAMNAFSRVNQDQHGEFQIQLTNSSEFYLRFNQSNSLKRLTLIDRFLTSEDFCRIFNIPSHLSIELPLNHPCSCSMYYLTRHHSSICPMNISFQCDLTNQISNCQQMEGEIQINIPRNLCPKEIHKISSNKSRSILIFVVISCLFLLGLVCLMFLKISRSNK